MSSTATPSQPAVSATTTAALPTLANIIGILAASRSLDDSMLQCLELLRTALGAAECAIWLHAPAGIRRAWGAGVEQVTGTEVEALLAANDPSSGVLVVARIVSADRRAGALAVRVSRTLDPV